MIEFLKYNVLGDYHWKEFLRPSIYRDHAMHVKQWIKDKNVLDAGCGDGLITYIIGAKGIDTSEVGISLAKNHGVNAEIGSVYELSGKYDAVYLGDVIEHLDDPDKCLKQISKITARLYLATPPRRDDGVLRPYHVREWNRNELETYMREHGWHLDGQIETKNDRMYGLFIYKP